MLWLVFIVSPGYTLPSEHTQTLCFLEKTSEKRLMSIKVKVQKSTKN